MLLSHYGHCAFLWTSPRGVRVLVDPFQNQLPRSDWFLNPFPAVEADVALVTHNHFDHNGTDRLSYATTLLRGPGAFEREDVRIIGVQDIHTGYAAPRLKRNTLFVVEVDGVRCCHIGDNRADLPDEVVAQLGRIDVLMVTVDDSSHLLSSEEVEALIERLSPRVVVPMHYYQEAITTVQSGLKSIEGWLATQSSVRRLGDSQIELTPADLPASREVWVFEPLVITEG